MVDLAMFSITLAWKNVSCAYFFMLFLLYWFHTGVLLVLLFWTPSTSFDHVSNFQKHSFSVFFFPFASQHQRMRYVLDGFAGWDPEYRYKSLGLDRQRTEKPAGNRS